MEYKRKEIIGNATLYLGDCLPIMEAMKENEVDAVVTDPPYGIAYVTNYRKVMDTPQAIIGDASIDAACVSFMYPLLKDGGAIYLATRFDVSTPWVEALQSAGFKMKTPIFWDKDNWTAGDLYGDYGGQIEIFLFAHKGRHLLKCGRLGNLWKCARPPAGDHPTPKPVPLIKRMIESSTENGAVVLDPFMGGGTAGVACAELGRDFIGIEIEEKYFDMACQRIALAQKQLKLF
jgi:site-specific DNA-methyltransferase (adenine-specific)